MKEKKNSRYLLVAVAALMVVMGGIGTSGRFMKSMPIYNDALQIPKDEASSGKYATVNPGVMYMDETKIPAKFALMVTNDTKSQAIRVIFSTSSNTLVAPSSGLESENIILSGSKAYPFSIAGSMLYDDVTNITATVQILNEIAPGLNATGSYRIGDRRFTEGGKETLALKIIKYKVGLPLVPVCGLSPNLSYSGLSLSYPGLCTVGTASALLESDSVYRWTCSTSTSSSGSVSCSVKKVLPAPITGPIALKISYPAPDKSGNVNVIKGQSLLISFSGSMDAKLSYDSAMLTCNGGYRVGDLLLVGPNSPQITCMGNSYGTTKISANGITRNSAGAVALTDIVSNSITVNLNGIPPVCGAFNSGGVMNLTSTSSTLCMIGTPSSFVASPTSYTWICATSTASNDAVKCAVNRPSCPALMPPAPCTNGTLVNQGTGVNGCQLPPICVLPRISVASPGSGAILSFSTPNLNKVDFSVSGVNSGSLAKVYVVLMQQVSSMYGTYQRPLLYIAYGTQIPLEGKFSAPIKLTPNIIPGQNFFIKAYLYTNKGLVSTAATPLFSIRK